MVSTYTQHELELMARLRASGLPPSELRIIHALKSLDATVQTGEPTHVYAWEEQ